MILRLKMILLLKQFFLKKFFFLITISQDYLLIFIIGNGRAVDDIFSEEMSNNLWKSNHFSKIVKKR